MKKQVLLLVDDNKDNLRSLELAFGRADYEVLAAAGGKAALAALKEREVDVVVSDLNMPDVDGMQVLKFALGCEPAPSVLMLTAFGSIESAVEALQAGAYHYLTKPVDLKDIRQQVARAMEHQRLLKENLDLRRQLERRFGFEEIIGEHQKMEALFDQIRLVANSRATVLIEAESGAGKELVARAIHRHSPRAKQPFIAVHCAALSESLLESELFGHEKGAFTGAESRRSGRFERADGGTLFLDEIGEIPLTMQVALLRVLETREFERVGGHEPLRVDVRLICATNKNLERMVSEGDFREDLFYRLNVVHLRIPPLRERPSDVPLLVNHFLKRFAAEHGKPLPQLTHRAMARLMAYSWPGNVRELRNLAENLVIFQREAPGRGGEPETVKAMLALTAENAPHLAAARNQTPGVIDEEDLPISESRLSDKGDTITFALGQNLDSIEREYIERSLARLGGNVTHTAAALGIGRRTLQRKLKEWGLEESPEE